jgi:hypothetical protein
MGKRLLCTGERKTEKALENGGFASSKERNASAWDKIMLP